MGQTEAGQGQAGAQPSVGASEVAAMLLGLSVVATGPALRALGHGRRYTLASIAGTKLTLGARAGLASLLAAAPGMLDALRPFAEQPTTDETPGVARDPDGDALIYAARAAIKAVQS